MLSLVNKDINYPILGYDDPNLTAMAILPTPANATRQYSQEIKYI